jgi:hypothetical protein
VNAARVIIPSYEVFMTHDVEALAYHVSYTSDILSGTDSSGMHTEWSGDVEATPLRGRIDFSSVSGKCPFGSGDYALFDNAGAIIVRPAAKTVIDVAPNPRAAQTAAEYQCAIKELQWTVDTLSDEEVIAGYDTVHCRATATYRFEVATSAVPFVVPIEVPQPIATTVADYWYAKVDGLPANPVIPFGSAGQNAPLGVRELVSMWASISAQLEPLGKPIQFRTVITVKTGDIVNRSHFGGAISNIHRVRIDPLALTAPAEFLAEGTGRDRWRGPPSR